MLVKLVTHLLQKVQVADDHLEVDRTLVMQEQEIGDIPWKKETAEKTRNVSSPLS